MTLPEELRSSLNVTTILILYLMFLTKAVASLKTNGLESNGWEAQRHLPGLHNSKVR